MRLLLALALLLAACTSDNPEYRPVCVSPHPPEWCFTGPIPDAFGYDFPGPDMRRVIVLTTGGTFPCGEEGNPCCAGLWCDPESVSPQGGHLVCGAYPVCEEGLPSPCGNCAWRF